MKVTRNRPFHAFCLLAGQVRANVAASSQDHNVSIEIQRRLNGKHGILSSSINFASG